KRYPFIELNVMCGDHHAHSANSKNALHAILAREDIAFADPSCRRFGTALHHALGLSDKRKLGPSGRLPPARFACIGLAQWRFVKGDTTSILPYASCWVPCRTAAPISALVFRQGAVVK